jgi:hypothetical protein
MNVIVNCYEYHCEKKTKKNLDKNNVFHCKPLSIMVSHDYIERVRFLEKSGSSFLPISKNSIFLNKKVYF